MDAKSRRHYKRFSTSKLDIHCRIKSCVPVVLLRLHPGGAYIRSGRKLKLGNHYTLHIDHEDRYLQVQGAAITEEQQDERAPGHVTGLKFDEIYTGDDSELIRLIKDSIDRETLQGSVKGLRVKLSGGRASHNYHGKYRIKKISFGGMLVETTKKLDVNSKVPFEIHIPADRKPLRALGRVASCLALPDTSPSTFDTGIEFLEMKGKDLHRLKDVIYIVQRQSSE
jgi:hypothetical protein